MKTVKEVIQYLEEKHAEIEASREAGNGDSTGIINAGLVGRALAVLFIAKNNLECAEAIRDIREGRKAA